MIAANKIPLGWGWPAPCAPAAAIASRRAPDPSRNTRILALYKRGETMGQIGRRMGISGARVHQIIEGYRAKGAA